MNREDAEEYTQALGQITAGAWRQIALAKKLGVPKALGLSVEEWVRTHLGGYVRLSIEERRAAVEELKSAANAAEDELSNREIADIIGVDEATVRRDAANAAPKQDAYTARIETGCTVTELTQLAGQKFGCIYADPPWLYDNQGTRAATKNHYEGMTVEELCRLPIEDLAADAAHLHLWTTNAFLFECPRIFEAWGFEFRSTFIWCKPQIGIGNYWRNSHEILLTAIRGSAKRFNDHNLKSWIECERGKHSDKPDQTRAFIERASPGPYLELFARREDPRQRWTVWGNEIERGLFHQSIPHLQTDQGDKFNALDDIQKSTLEGFRAIRKRKAQGGPGWKGHEDDSSR